MNFLYKEAPKVASNLKKYEKDVFEWSVAGVPYPAAAARRLRTSSSASRT